MTEARRLFLVQARSDFIVFEWLHVQSSLPPCHALNYLQMSTELFGKAHAWKNGPNHLTHRALVGFLRSLTGNRRAQRRLRFEGKNEKWENLIRSSIPLAQRIEDLAPALTQDGPNPEYPWPRADPVMAPAELSFGLWEELAQANGRQFLGLLANLFSSAETYL